MKSSEPKPPWFQLLILISNFIAPFFTLCAFCLFPPSRQIAICEKIYFLVWPLFWAHGVVMSVTTLEYHWKAFLADLDHSVKIGRYTWSNTCEKCGGDLMVVKSHPCQRSCTLCGGLPPEALCSPYSCRHLLAHLRSNIRRWLRW
jgi:hypothetical protein